MNDQDPQPVTRAANAEPTAQRGGLTGSGAMELLVDLSQNPTVAATTAVATGVGLTKLLNRPKEPPPPDPPPKLWVPPGTDD